MLKKKILITGANSFLGQSAAQMFSKKGYIVFGCCRNPDLIINNLNFEKILPYSTLEVPLNLLPKDINILFHCESQTSILKSFEFKENLKSHSSKIIKKLMEIALRCSSELHIIFPSSAAVYGDKNSQNLKETLELKPISPYGLEKAYFEESLHTLTSNRSFNCSVIRFFSLFGPIQKKQIIWDTFNKLKYSDKPIFFGTGNEIRDFFYISDAINLIELLIKRNRKFTIINGGTGIGTTVIELIKIIKDILGYDKEIIFNQLNRDGDPFSLVASFLFLKKIGFVSKITLIDGLRKTILSYD